MTDERMCRQTLAERAISDAALPARLLVIVMVSLLFCFIVWASLFDIDIRVKGSGKVIPTSKLQEIQHFEGGVVREILVAEGDIVDAGQILVRLNPRRAQKDLGEVAATAEGLHASVIRLQAELNGVEPVYPPYLHESAPEFIQSEERLRLDRQGLLGNQLQVLISQKQQKQAEAEGFAKRLPNLQRSLTLLRREIKSKQRLVKQKAAAPSELISLQREEAELLERIYSAQQQQNVVQEFANEMQARIDEKTNSFRAEAQQQLSEQLVRREALQGNVLATRDAVSRTDVVAPVRGIIKTLVATTIGGVVRSGETIIELVPLDERLLIEAQVAPADIAQLKKGLEANVRLSAFDSLISGGIKSKLERISPDSQKDEKNGRTFYRVYVRTESDSIDTAVGRVQILPGMEADVDILTGRRTVMDYLLKPVIRGFSRALAEK